MKRCNLPYTSERARNNCGLERMVSVSDEQTAQSGLMEAASLSVVELFKGLPDSHLRALDERSKVENFRAGHIFFRTGESGQGLFVLEKGAVQTFRTFGPKKLIVADLTPPSVFGEMGCVGQCTYHCAAKTTQPSRIRTISRADLDALLDQYPIITRRLLDLVSERFFHVLMDLEATSFRQLIPRLANLLLERMEGDRIRNVTHRELAEHLHVYRESATAALGELRKAGIVEVERKQIRILDRARLERAARE